MVQPGMVTFRIRPNRHDLFQGGAYRHQRGLQKVGMPLYIDGARLGCAFAVRETT
jgi:hypothetical protein